MLEYAAVTVVLLCVLAFIFCWLLVHLKGVKWDKYRLTPAERRTRAGLCPNCGYDMRATPDHDGPRHTTCPECGQPAPAQWSNPERFHDG